MQQKHCGKFTHIERADLSGSSMSQLEEITCTCMRYMFKECNLVEEFLQEKEVESDMLATIKEEMGYALKEGLRLFKREIR